VFKVTDGSEALRISEHQQDIKFVQFSSDGHFIISSGDDAVNVWDLGRRAHVAKLDAKSGLLSNNGKRLVTQGDKNTLILWELEP
jgi:WD40 repeat protein